MKTQEERQAMRESIIYWLGILAGICFGLVIALCVITSVSALTIYPGENQTFTPGSQNLINFTNMSISNNISLIEFNFTNESAYVKIPKDAEPQSPIISFTGYKNQQEITTTRTGSGGRGSYNPNWNKTINNTKPIIEVRNRNDSCAGKFYETYQDMLDCEAGISNKGITNGTIGGKIDNPKDKMPQWELVLIIVGILAVLIILGYWYNSRRFKRMGENRDEKSN